jgi:Na+-transporting NADH:ubiquinone oxidoreductase subunit NqrF
MQTEKDGSELILGNPEFKKQWKEENAHFVFVTGENGIHTVFDLIKSKLKNDQNSCLTLIYFTTAYVSQPLFKAELESLEKRFPTKLITHYLFSANQINPENTTWHQQILEIVINSNTCNTMPFLILGDDELVAFVSDRLHFLGVKSNHIYSHITI